MENGSPKLCICQICTCGRHKCPHRRRSLYVSKPCEISEYNTQFIPRELVPVKSCKPPHRGVAGEGPMASDTTMRLDYVPHPLSMTPSAKKEPNLKSGQGTFDGLTTYTKEYTGKPGQLVVPIKPVVRKGSTAKFGGESTFTAHYRPWVMEKHELAPGRPASLVTPNVPFSGTSTYTSHYVGHNEKPPASCKPRRRFPDNQTPFSDSTNYRDAYRTLDLTERTRPIKHPDHAGKPTAPIESDTTQKRDYYWKTITRSASCKPEYMGIQCKEPFPKDTTQRTDYKSWGQTEKRGPIIPMTSLTSQGKISSDTTYNKYYVPFEAQKSQTIHPVDKLGVKLPPFHGISDYNDSYRRWSTEPLVKSLGRGPSFTIPNVKFKGKSTTSDHYKPYSDYRPPESIKPHTHLPTTEGPFEDATLYRMDYTPKYVEPCPASLLNTSESKYVYNSTNETGHDIYCRTSNSLSTTTTDQRPVTSPNETFIITDGDREPEPEMLRS
ncbi:unnamed protein product [Schistosoma turkestanicum]|nr:unnamed protein product [Schistosoma turkestanicum]